MTHRPTHGPAMTLVTTQLLPPGEALGLLARAREMVFTDGKRTAGSWGRERKQNQQVTAGHDEVAKAVLTAFSRNSELGRRLFAVEMTAPMINRYGVGDFYATHTDAPMQAGMRADLSYTLFLSDPSDYEGGELVLGRGQQPGTGARSFKLGPGEVVVYAAGTAHQVTPVTRGERYACVGWVRSAVPDLLHRDVLTEFADALDRLWQEGTRGEPFVALADVHARLAREWMRG